MSRYIQIFLRLLLNAPPRQDKFGLLPQFLAWLLYAPGERRGIVRDDSPRFCVQSRIMSRDAPEAVHSRSGSTTTTCSRGELSMSAGARRERLNPNGAVFLELFPHYLLHQRPAQTVGVNRYMQPIQTTVAALRENPGGANSKKTLDFRLPILTPLRNSHKRRILERHES